MGGACTECVNVSYARLHISLNPLRSKWRLKVEPFVRVIVVKISELSAS
jgi:hypothetical protein